MNRLRNLGECILASKYPRRQEILSIIDLNFKVYPSKINEKEFLEYPPEVSAKLCAEKKAETVSKIFENNLIIAADTLVLCKGKILGKPETETESYEMLNMLSGSIHKVVTGVAIQKKNENLIESFHSTTEVKIKPLSDEIIKFYIKVYKPFDKAGSYGIQDWFASQVDSIKGCYYNVMGLPLSKLFSLLLTLSSKK